MEKKPLPKYRKQLFSYTVESTFLCLPKVTPRAIQGSKLYLSVLLWKCRKSEHNKFYVTFCTKRNQRGAHVAEWIISRVHCRRGRRLFCSTSALLDTDRHGSSTQHTWGCPGAERSALVSLKHQRQKQLSTLYCDHANTTDRVISITLMISNLCMVQCTHVRIHCGSISHPGDSCCH